MKLSQIVGIMFQGTTSGIVTRTSTVLTEETIRLLQQQRDPDAERKLDRQHDGGEQEAASEALVEIAGR